jgi:hypothetical protein
MILESQLVHCFCTYNRNKFAMCTLYSARMRLFQSQWGAYKPRHNLADEVAVRCGTYKILVNVDYFLPVSDVSGRVTLRKSLDIGCRKSQGAWKGYN